MHKWGKVAALAVVALVATSLIVPGCSDEKKSDTDNKSTPEAEMVVWMDSYVERTVEIAARNQCANNLRKIGKAMEIYAGTEEAYPAYINPDTDDISGEPDNFDPILDTLTERVDTQEIFVCPSETSSDEEPATQPDILRMSGDGASEDEDDTVAEDAAADTTASPTKIGQIKLGGTVLESPPDFSLFDFQGNRVTLKDWLNRLAKARSDASIAAVAIEIDSPRVGLAQAMEIADAIRRLADVKPVYAHVTSADMADFIIASGAKHVSMEPTAMLDIVGIGTELLFFRGTLDWIGVTPQFVQAGRFKGAGENLTRTEPSEELKENLNWLLDDLYEQLCGQIASNRGLTADEVKTAIDEGPLAGPAALKYKFVDDLVEKADWEEHVRKLATADRELEWVDDYAAPSDKGLDSSNPFALLNTLLGSKTTKATKDPTVAVIHADGMIISGRSGEGFFGQRYVGDETIVACFDRVRKDPNVKAVVFRINSPGGSALASELIYQAVRKCAEVKPVIASIAQLGASGGYYIACGAREIMADNVAIVGSIGVISGKLADGGVLEKLGITTFEITRGKNAGMKLIRPWNDRELAKIQELTDQTYETFIKRVKSARGDKIGAIEDVAEGRVFTAAQGIKNGLIDRLGGMRDAITAARKAAGIKGSDIITLPRPKTLMDMLQDSDGVSMGSIFADRAAAINRMVENFNGVVYLVNLAELFNGHTVLTAVPYYLNVSY